jgi:hypothetical protein
MVEGGSCTAKRERRVRQRRRQFPSHGTGLQVGSRPVGRGRRLLWAGLAVLLDLVEGLPGVVSGFAIETGKPWSGNGQAFGQASVAWVEMQYGTTARTRTGKT